MYATVAALLFSLTARAGITLNWERGATPLTMRCEGQSARIDGSTGTVIWDAAAKTLSVVRPSDQTYTKLTEAQLVELKDRGEKKLAELKAKYQGDPQKLAQLEAMSAQAGVGPGAPKLDPKPTGKQSKVGPWKCELHEAEAGAHRVTWCLVPWDAAPAKKDELACLAAVARIVGQLARGLDGPAEDLTVLPGLPVETVRQSPDGKKLVTTLKAVERGKLPEGTFSVPAGYQLKTPPGMR